MNCKYKIKRSGRTVVMKISGRLVTEEANFLAEKLDAISFKDADKLILDISELQFIDSHGLGVLVYAWKTFNESDTRLFFYNPTGFVKDMFESTKLSEMFKFCSDLEGE